MFLLFHNEMSNFPCFKKSGFSGFSGIIHMNWWWTGSGWSLCGWLMQWVKWLKNPVSLWRITLWWVFITNPKVSERQVPFNSSYSIKFNCICTASIMSPNIRLRRRWRREPSRRVDASTHTAETLGFASRWQNLPNQQWRSQCDFRPQQTVLWKSMCLLTDFFSLKRWFRIFTLQLSKPTWPHVKM